MPIRIGRTTKPIRSSVNAWLTGSVLSRSQDGNGTGRSQAATVFTCGLLSGGVAPLATRDRDLLRPVGLDQRAQAPIVLVACRASFEVGAHSRHDHVGVRSGELRFDEAVELGEALLAGE